MEAACRDGASADHVDTVHSLRCCHRFCDAPSSLASGGELNDWRRVSLKLQYSADAVAITPSVSIAPCFLGCDGAVASRDLTIRHLDGSLGSQVPLLVFFFWPVVGYIAILGAERVMLLLRSMLPLLMLVLRPSYAQEHKCLAPPTTSLHNLPPPPPTSVARSSPLI